MFFSCKQYTTFCRPYHSDRIIGVHLNPPVCLCFCTATVASAFQVTLYQIGGSFAFGGKTYEHANARGASRRKRVLACLQVVCRLYQLSKNDSSPLSEKKPFYIIPDPHTPFWSSVLFVSHGEAGHVPALELQRICQTGISL